MHAKVVVVAGFQGIGPRSFNGNIFSGGNVVPFARGGIVDFPALFPMSGNRIGADHRAILQEVPPLLDVLLDALAEAAILLGLEQRPVPAT